MPCRRAGVERLLLLERAPAVALASGGGGAVGPSSSGSKEVDALVAKLGEVLQLSAGRRAPPPAVERSPCRLPPKHHSRDRTAPYSSPRGLGFLAALPRRHSSLVLLTPPDADAGGGGGGGGGGSPRVAKQLCGRGWLRGSAARVASPGSKKRHYYGGRGHPLPSHALLAEEDEEEDGDGDPHRLLQQLILSGSLIKEAVRRLQLAATTVNAATPSETTSTTGSAASSAGSCCHSSGGERDSGAAALVPPLP